MVSRVSPSVSCYNAYDLHRSVFFIRLKMDYICKSFLISLIQLYLLLSDIFKILATFLNGYEFCVRTLSIKAHVSYSPKISIFRDVRYFAMMEKCFKCFAIKSKRYNENPKSSDFEILHTLILM